MNLILQDNKINMYVDQKIIQVKTFIVCNVCHTNISELNKK